MRGFARRATVEAALAWIDTAVSERGLVGAEEVPLLEAAGRVLACDVTSSVNVPGFCRATMDGFALHAEDTQGASTYNRLPLKSVGASMPGKGFDGRVGVGEAVQIMTGAPMPKGADAVLPFEQTQTEGKRVFALGNVSPQKNVGRIGEDVAVGDVALHSGQLMRPQDIGMLSSLGFSHAPVVQRPRVRILVTGNELLPMGTPPQGFQITDANGPMLTSLVARDGGAPVLDPVVPDDRGDLLAAMRREADVLLVSGGSSVGQEDHAPTLLAEFGELAVHGIAMRPSSPTGMGRLEGRLVFLLPGNPVSCLCAYDFFAGRAIRVMGGRGADWPYRRVRARLTRKLASVVGRVDYARVRVQGAEAEPLAIGGASVLSSVTQADGFVIIAANSEGYQDGAEVEVFLYQ
jgi:molybdopterin molybdotransferase